MSTLNAAAAAATDQRGGELIPLFVCAGCRPEPLGYVSIALGGQLDEMIACPMRDVCTWHAAHDLGGSMHYNEQPDGIIIEALFRTDPYFSCPNFHDFAGFGSVPPLSPPAPRPQREPTLLSTTPGSTSSATSA
jgi:hypothetical protein